MPPSTLTPEEDFIYACARTWRKPSPGMATASLDWMRVAAIARANRMDALLLRLLRETGLLARLPDPAVELLQEEAARAARSAAVMAESLQEILRLAAERGIETVVLKGLSLSVNLYGDPNLRPGGDIDLLVRKRDVAASLEVLESRDIGRYWPNLMDDRYYGRHHLHQQRCSPDLRLWYEIHWALDHPLTRLTIDYEAVMDRAVPGELLGAPLHELSWADNLIALSVHLVKHAVYLPAVLDRADLARIILADGALMNFLDVAELVKQGDPQAEWPALLRLCSESGTVHMVGSVLAVCHQLLGTPAPGRVLQELAVSPPGPARRAVMERLVGAQVAKYLGQGESRLWQFLLVTNGAFILRPIRLLDLVEYLLPGRDYLQRQYGGQSVETAAKHFLRGMGRYARLALDTIGFMWERYWRLRRLKYSTSLFNRLEVEA